MCGREKKTLCLSRMKTVWRLEKHAKDTDKLNLRIGRWNVPGNPIAILVDFAPFYGQKMKFTLRHGWIIRLTRYMRMAIMMKPQCFRMRPER